MIRPFFCLASLSVLLAACSEGPTGPSCQAVSLPLAAAAAAGDTVTTSTGLRYIQVEAGTGAVAGTGDRATIQYAGMFTNGTLFDRGAFGFQLGSGGVIAGFDQGVTGMQLCSTRRIIVPAGLGYGDTPPRGSGIPAGATLIFDVQLLELDD